jgi:uncharacterized protein (DUF1697 family)
MRYAIFLRAINVGKHNRITMEALRALLGPLGYRDVKTYLQSGNLVLDADESSVEVTARLEEALVGAGLRNASVIARTQDELLDLLASAPFAEYDPAQYRRYVTFLAAPLAPKMAQTISIEPGLVTVRPGELLAVNSIAMPNPNFNRLINRDLGVASTTRYWNVVEAVTALLDPAENGAPRA